MTRSAPSCHDRRSLSPGPIPRSSPVAFLIRRMERGGAEGQLCDLVNGLHRRGRPVCLLSLYDPPGTGALALAPDLPCASAGKRCAADPRLLRLVHPLRHFGANTLCCLLYPALASSLVLKPLAGVGRVVWTIRSSGHVPEHLPAAARLVIRSVAWLYPRYPDLVIANSEAGRRWGLGIGVPPDRLAVVPNGADGRRFRIDRASGAALRQHWGMTAEHILIGHVGRLHPMKDHLSFLRAAAAIARELPQARFICVGQGRAPYTAQMKALASQLELDSRLIWAGQRHDMPAVYNALDLAVLPSAYGEGMSNALLEAMLSGVACVASRVGDAAAILGHSGRLVHAGQQDELAQAILDLLRNGDGQSPAARREHVLSHFAVEKMLSCMEALLWGED